MMREEKEIKKGSEWKNCLVGCCNLKTWASKWVRCDQVLSILSRRHSTFSLSLSLSLSHFSWWESHPHRVSPFISILPFPFFFTSSYHPPPPLVIMTRFLYSVSLHHPSVLLIIVWKEQWSRFSSWWKVFIFFHFFVNGRKKREECAKKEEVRITRVVEGEKCQLKKL